MRNNVKYVDMFGVHVPFIPFKDMVLLQGFNGMVEQAMKDETSGGWS